MLKNSWLEIWIQVIIIAQALIYSKKAIFVQFYLIRYVKYKYIVKTKSIAYYMLIKMLWSNFIFKNKIYSSLYLLIKLFKQLVYGFKILDDKSFKFFFIYIYIYIFLERKSQLYYALKIVITLLKETSDQY